MSDDLDRGTRDLDATVPPRRTVPSRYSDDGSELSFPPSYDSDASAGDGGDPFYALRILHKWRWIAVTVFFLIVAGTAIHTFNTVPVYEARVRVLVEPERINILKIQDVVQEDRSTEAQIAVLQSRWLARETMQALQLLKPPAAPAVAGSASTSSLSFVRAMWSSAKAGLSDFFLGQSSQPEPAAVDAPGAENAQIDGFLGGLSVTSSTKGVVDIRYRSSDPALAARIANGHARQYIDENVETRFSAIKEVSDWLTARVTEQRQKVDDAEHALQTFRERNEIVVAAGAENPAIAKLNELTAAVTRTKTARLEKESIVNKARALRADSAVLLRLPPIAADPLVQQLRLELERLQRERAQMAETLQARHPDMVRNQSAIQAVQTRLQIEMDRVLDAMGDDVTTARATENSLAAALEQQKMAAMSQNRKGVEFGILEREAQSAHQIYDMLIQRARETSIEQEARPNQIRVLDPAEVPRAPISPRVQQNMLLALFGGLLFAVAAAFGLEQLDSRMKNPDEIRTRLGLPLLGFLPEVRLKKGSEDLPIMTNGVPSAFLEAMRSIRTNVVYSFTDESLKAIVVTSAGLSEGKTVTASNLAIAIAQTGGRVLLIDADMRRPTLHQFFKLKRDPGLSNLLIGNVKASEAVQASGVPNLWILPSGHRPPNPPELLGSQRFKSMIAAFADHFDWVLLDAPPVMAVTDACVLADKSTGVVFVVGAERVSRQVARRALEQLGNVDARIIGGILTRVNVDRHRYYYSKYYHPRYSEYASLGSRDL